MSISKTQMLSFSPTISPAKLNLLSILGIISEPQIFLDRSSTYPCWWRHRTHFDGQ